MQPWNMDGWRFGMRCVSAVSFTVAMGVALFAADPRTLPPATRPAAASADDDEKPLLPQSTVSAGPQHRYAVDAGAGGRTGRPPLAPNGVLPTAVASAAASNAPGAATARGGRRSFLRAVRAAGECLWEISSMRTFQIIIAQVPTPPRPASDPQPASASVLPQSPGAALNETVALVLRLFVCAEVLWRWPAGCFEHTAGLGM